MSLQKSFYLSDYWHPLYLLRKILFPIGRWFGSLLRPTYREGQRGPWLQALGEYKPHRTHAVTLVRTDLQDIYESFDPAIYTDDPCAISVPHGRGDEFRVDRNIFPLHSEA